MKRFFALFLCITTFSIAFAGNGKVITIEDVPANIKQFIHNNFRDVNIASVRMEDDKNYEVVLASGVKMEFDKEGEWRDIEDKQSGVPLKIVPPKIAEHVKVSQEQKITKITRDKKGSYTVQVENGRKLVFDKKFYLVSVND